MILERFLHACPFTVNCDCYGLTLFLGPYVGGELITTAGFEPAISLTLFILSIGSSLQTESLFSGEFPILHVALGWHTLTGVPAVKTME